ncbi:MAG: amidohydrolase family protein, partial [Lentisphaeria bacterium]|nr:amidohydrolase family protein [Lentisphaeria bacterium]
MENTKRIYRNARVIDPATSTDEIRDVGVENGLFADPDKLGKDAQIIDLKGYVLAPGFTDMHVHLRQPGNTNAETIRTGALAAAAGGFTHIVPMPNTSPCTDNPGTIQY